MLHAVREIGYTLLQSPQFRALLAVWWLLPCAIQDRRSATVSPLLTVPLFVAAWPVAWLAGGLWPRLALVAFTFVLSVVLFKPTDARMATGLAALCGFGGFVVYLVVQLAAFRLVHIANGKILGVIGGFTDSEGRIHLPAGLWFYVAALVWFWLSPSAIDGLTTVSYSKCGNFLGDLSRLSLHLSAEVRTATGPLFLIPSIQFSSSLIHRT